MDEKETHVGKRDREEEVNSAETGKGRRPTAEGDFVRGTFRQEQLACMVAHVLRTHHRRACSRLIATHLSPSLALLHHLISLCACVCSTSTRGLLNVLSIYKIS